MGNLVLSFAPYDIAADCDFLYAAHRETSEITFGTPFDDATIEKELTQYRDVRDGAYHGSKIIGICDIARRFSDEYGDYGNVNFFYIMPEYRNLGFGGQLVEHAVYWCRVQGLRLLLLRTGKTNYTARKCYEKNGFARLPSRDTVHEMGYIMEI